MKTPVTRLLDNKGHDVITIDPDLTVYDAVKCMSEREVGSLIVVAAEGGKPLGIITERDCRDTILHDQDPHKVRIRDCMSTELISVTRQTSIEDCMNFMTERRVRHLPVIERDSLTGIISIGDVVKYLYSEREQMVENLEKYITGSM